MSGRGGGEHDVRHQITTLQCRKGAALGHFHLKFKIPPNLVKVFKNIN